METLQRTANRGSISTGFDIDNSLKLEADNSEYLHFTPSSQTDYERLAFSIWVKRTEIRTTQTIAEFGNGTANTTQLRIGFDSSDRLFVYGNSIVWRESTQIFADTNAWYHLFFLFDTTQGTSNDRIRIWVNGNMIAHTDFNTVNNPGSGTAMGFNKTNQQSLGAQREDGPKNYLNGYIAQAWASGGTPPVVTDFGEVDSDTGIWKPIDITGVSVPDGNGFFLDFSDSSDLGNDSSSNNNDFTLVNLSSADQATDVPTNNFNVFTMLHAYGSSYAATITEGGTKVAFTPANWAGAKGSFGLINGKWYWEFTLMGNLSNGTFGIQTTNTLATIYNHHAIQNNNTIFIGYPGLNYYYWTGGSQTSDESTGWASSTPGAGDVFGFALDLDNSTKRFFLYRNGTLLNGASGTNLPTPFQNEYVSPFVGGYQADGQRWNFGGYTSATISSAASDENNLGVFEYAPPTGFYALCTKNLAEYG